MPVFRLDERLIFPRPEQAHESGLLAVGGDLSPERVLLAYSQGIFPWPHEGLPLLWHSPDPRFAFFAEDLHVPTSLAKQMRRGIYEVRLDTAFDDVMLACSEVPRPGQDGTWITDDMRKTYGELHRRGVVHSAEAWQDGVLVGGLYGVSLGGAFFGESMFARAPDASKVAFATLVQQLLRWNIRLIDCQTETPHLARFGATPWPRPRFLRELAIALKAPTRKGPWRLDAQGATGNS